uniref:Serine protease n=1 Tax=uncultured organism TaxID=155900 RepID=D7GN95_9ZZZZ|nr:serine protease [uncultured organism]
MELERELIVITRAEEGAPVPGAAPVDLSRIVSEAGGAMHRLFTAAPEAPPEALGAGAAAGALPAEVTFYRVDAPDERLEDLARRLQELPTVEAAYVKPPASPAVLTEVELPRGELGINDMSPRPEEPAATPDFTSRQGYLNAAPEGIDARFAWTRPGGSGAGVRIIDIEGAWRFTHEDLAQNQGGMVFGAASSDLGWRNHGTAVIGEFGGDRNTFGITGICPDANVRAISIFGGVGSAGAIRQAADLLNPGDVILIELHRAGPRHNFAPRLDQAGYVAIEWWPDDYQAIRYAVNKGVIVVEAAGNGQENLDDAIYDTNPPAPFGPFPSWWRNPYRRAPLDSGAIVVGAGAPPPGTHGRNHGPDRSRLGFSNYGALVDAQGWGREVTTTGYGDLQGGSNEDLWYTDTFSGTSSASPIVVGAIAGVQGVLGAAGRIPMSPARAREVLRATGSPQQDAPGRPAAQRIGNRPNMRQMIDYVLPTRTWIGVQFTGVVPANQTSRWFTHSWPAHWHVIWTVVPTSVTPGGPQIRWRVQVERASDRHITYWIEITNLTNVPVNIEARYAVLGW